MNRVEPGQWWYSNSNNQRVIVITDVHGNRVEGWNSKTRRPFSGLLKRFGSEAKDGFTMIGAKKNDTVSN